jgi:hypothetical protein
MMAAKEEGAADDDADQGEEVGYGGARVFFFYAALRFVR